MVPPAGDARSELEADNRNLHARRAALHASKAADQETAKANALAPLQRLVDTAKAREAEIDAKIKHREASNRSARGVAAPQGADHPPATDRRRHAAKRTSNRGRKTANTKPSPAKLTEHELETALVAAKTADDVCAAVTRAVYAEQHDGVKCPDKRVPKWTEMVQWWHRDGPQSLASEARKALCVVLDENAQWLPWPLGTDSPSDVRATYPIETELKVSTSVTIPFLDVTEVHRRWLALQPRPSHPLAPFLICFWQFASVETKQDQHDFAIIPHPLRNAERDKGRLPLALDDETPLGSVRKYNQGYLPGLEPAASPVPPVSWLTLYDLTGAGPIQTRGRGAPLAQRLFVEVLTAVPIADRDPEWITAPPITLRDLFTWCWPRWYDRKANRMRGGYNRAKHLEPLRRALLELDNIRIEYGRYERRLIRVDDLPTDATRLDDPIRFHIRHIPGSDRGPLIERTSVRRWGLTSAAAYRSTIRLAYLWDDAKARNNGSRIFATRPAVARGPGGVIVGADGKPLRDHRGAVVTDWSDRRAVILGANGKLACADNPPAYERNPAADRVPMLGRDDLIRLAFDAAPDLTPTTRRWRLHNARHALAAMEAAGEVVIERSGDGTRIIEARPPATRQRLILLRANADPATCQR